MSIPLHLTGSHYFGTAGPDSDVDFFAADSAAARAYLEACGFVAVQWKPGPGANVRAVYWHGVTRVHVQLVADVELKERIQRAMREYGLGPHLMDKVLSKRLWRLAYTLAPVNGE